VTTAGAVSEFQVPTLDSGPRDIAAGSDGAMWFTELLSGKMARVATGEQPIGPPLKAFTCTTGKRKRTRLPATCTLDPALSGGKLALTLRDELGVVATGSGTTTGARTTVTLKAKKAIARGSYSLEASVTVQGRITRFTAGVRA